MESEENEQIDFELGDEYSKSNDQNENIDNLMDNNLNAEEPTDDFSLNDATDKTQTDINNVQTTDETPRSEPGSDRSRVVVENRVDIINDHESIKNEELDEETLLKLESDPSYVPGDFPTLPSQFNEEDFPLSYKENSLKEELCLEFVDNFKRQYRHLYGDRKPLYIKPKNECNIEKFVCTSINPTKLPYPEVYYWEGAAKFVAEFLTLVPIVPCTEVPSRLISPMTALKLQRGTCFEYSTFLCSLLLGVGYNAYVVSGYATKEVCFMNQSRRPCSNSQIENEKKENHVENNKNRYTIRPPKDLRSKFELEQIAKKEKQAENERLKQQKMLEEQENLLEQPRHDPLFGQRVHSWVLILAGKREIGETFFIEPLTGKACGVTCKDYLGIESLWNHKNYWVNMQLGIGGVGQINFDLNNSLLWEYLLPGQESVSIIPPIGLDESYEPTDEEQENSDIPQKYFDLPRSWTMPIQINLKDFQQRSLEGKKETIYRKAKLETYSVYQNVDGLMTRCKRYEDIMLNKNIETEEHFQNRNDKLIRRVINPVSGMIFEYFEKGKKSRLAEHHYYMHNMQEHSRTMKFYHDARVDHLMEIENSENKLITRYCNREDFLIKRTTLFGKIEKKFGPANSREYRRPFETIIEAYSRNPAIPAHKDIHEVVFHISEDRISVAFHTADENIAGDTVEFLKSNLSSEYRKENAIQLIKDSYTYFQIDAFRPKLTEVEIYEYYNYLIEKENGSKEGIREEEKEMIEILKLRDKENIENKLDISLFDRVRNEAAHKTRLNLEKTMEEKKLITKDVELDYLEPFLLQMNINLEDEITKENAIKLYTKCLQDFKERLINKANLLQARFEKETGLLQEKQQWYQQNQNVMQKQDEEEYLQFCNEATFRINTLEKMLARHKQISKYKESDLDKKMRNDKRIGRFLNLK